MYVTRCWLTLVLVLGACPDANRKPSGTTNDPVDVCERIMDVCRIDKAKLGVCTQKRGEPGFACASQH